MRQRGEGGISCEVNYRLGTVVFRLLFVTRHGREYELSQNKSQPSIPRHGPFPATFSDIFELGSENFRSLPCRPFTTVFEQIGLYRQVTLGRRERYRYAKKNFLIYGLVRPRICLKENLSAPRSRGIDPELCVAEGLIVS